MTSAQVNAQKAEQSLKLHLNEAVTPGRLPGGGGVGPSPSDRPYLLGKRRDRAVAVTEGSPGSGSCSQHALGRAPRAAPGHFRPDPETEVVLSWGSSPTPAFGGRARRWRGPPWAAQGTCSAALVWPLTQLLLLCIKSPPTMPCQPVGLLD